MKSARARATLCADAMTRRLDLARVSRHSSPRAVSRAHPRAMSPRDVLEASRAGDEKAAPRALYRCVKLQHLVAQPSIRRLGRAQRRVVIHHDAATREPGSAKTSSDASPRALDLSPRPSQASASIATLLASSTDPMTGAGPLHLAAERGSLACVATLLESDPTRHSPRDDERAVPLHYAAARGHDVIVRALLHAGAVPDARDVPTVEPRAQTHAGARVFSAASPRRRRSPRARDPRDAPAAIKNIRTTPPMRRANFLRARPRRRR